MVHPIANGPGLDKPGTKYLLWIIATSKVDSKNHKKLV